MIKPLRRLYDWTLHWADTPYGPVALVIIAFAESSFFPIPPDVLLIALCIGSVRKSFWFATLCSIGSVVGGVFGYEIGALLWHTDATVAGYRIGAWLWGVEGHQFSPVADFFFTYLGPFGFTHENFALAEAKYNAYGFWCVFIAAFTPIPYKVFTIASGIFDMNFGGFLLASVIGRSMRFFMVAGLIRLFGQRIRLFIDKYFNLITVIFTVLLVGFIYLTALAGKHATNNGAAPTNAPAGNSQVEAP